MTAATPGPPPRDHHDGQVTPGQAAYEAYLAHLQGADPAYGQWVKPFAAIDKHDQDAWEAAAAAAITAQPQPAPGSLRAELEATVKTWREESEPYPFEDALDTARRGGFGYCADELAALLGQYPAPKPALSDHAAEPEPDLRALLDHETRLTWQSGLPGERARVAAVREQAGLEAL